MSQGHPGRNWPKAFWCSPTHVFVKCGNSAFPGPSAGPGEAAAMLAREALALHLFLLFVLLKEKGPLRLQEGWGGCPIHQSQGNHFL